MVSTSRPRRAGSVSVGLIVVASFAALISIGAQSPTDPSIKRAVIGAVGDIRDAATFKAPWTAGSLPAAARQATHMTLATRMSQHMAGKALAHWKGILDAAIDRDSDGAHVIVTAGGVDKSEFDSIAIDGTHAAASGRMHTWVTWVIHDQSVPGPHAGRPSGWDVFEASLDQVGGQWYVTDLTLQPEFGG